uniref:C-type lectin domain-containing protein n=1 Tax=Mola mola TaxID=94237 RepID=A0A3Q3VXC1_MOLML
MLGTNVCTDHFVGQTDNVSLVLYLEYRTTGQDVSRGCHLPQYQRQHKTGKPRWHFPHSQNKQIILTELLKVTSRSHHDFSYLTMTFNNMTLKIARNSVSDTAASLKNLTEERDEFKRILGDYRWVYFRGSFYYASSTKKTWEQSRNDCLQKGADLVIINSKEEQAFTNQLKKYMWIGLTDSQIEGTWRWVDGSPLTKSYWSSGEPNVDSISVLNSFKTTKVDSKCFHAYTYISEDSWTSMLHQQ